MAWSSEFMSRLTEGVYSPRWVLEALTTPVSGAGDLYTSHGSAPAIARAPRVTPPPIRADSWTRAGGTWSVDLVDSGARAILYAPRGTFVRLLLGLGTLDRSQMEPVALGVVQSVTYGPGYARITCWDILTGLQSRLTTSHAYLSLFVGVQTASTLSADYTVGDNHLHVTDETVFQREAGGTGAVIVQPTTGDAFLLTYTGTAAGQLTGISATGACGTTAADAASGKAVTNVAYIKGHPVDIIRKVLTSGSGAGAYDTLPDYWGLALDPDLLDNDDLDDWKARLCVSTGSYEWEVVVAEKMANGIGWLQGLLSAAGIWLTVRQGRIVARAALDVDDSRMPAPSISEDDLVEGDAWSGSAIDPEISTEYHDVQVLVYGTSSTTVSAGLQTLPAQARRTYDLSGIVFSNASAIAAETCRRLSAWVLRPPETFTLRLRGWRAAQWCDGDVVTLRLPRLVGRVTAFGGSYATWNAVVKSVAPDWSGHSTEVRVWPDRENPS